MGVLRIGQRALCYGLGREPSRFCQLSGAAFCSSLTNLVRAGSNAVETCGTPSTLCPGWILSGGDERRHGGA